MYKKSTETIRFLLNSRRYLHRKYPELDFDYLCNPENAENISRNISSRKGIGNIKVVQELFAELSRKAPEDKTYETTKQKLYSEALKIPNESHGQIIQYGDEPVTIKLCGVKPKFSTRPKEFHALTKHLNIMRTLHLGNVAGNRSYYLLGDLSTLEQSLVKYAVNKLLRLGFQLVSVPDVVSEDVVESCGMNTKGERTQIYKLDPVLHGEGLCLSGTSEIGIASYLKGRVFDAGELPRRFVAVSRCFRAEASSVAEEKGIYRVHQFTKVEMFAVTTQEQSEETLRTFLEIQENLFTSLGLHFRVLDMPCHELGAPAFRKYDIEAWMPGRQMFGEISSCSNCTDYQSRRLDIKYGANDRRIFAHTLNGTACAIPRTLIALLETYQLENGNVRIPGALQSCFGGRAEITKEKRVPELKLRKTKR